MISHKYRCIFIHIPRTGGTSIERALCGPTQARLLSWAAESSSLRKKGRRGQAISKTMRGRRAVFALLNLAGLPKLHRKLYGAKHFKAQQARRFYGEDVWQAYFTFAFVRNTWDRLVSSYHFRRNVLNYEVESRTSFRDWVLRRCESSEEVKRQGQRAALSDDNGELIVDWVGRFEDLQSGFETVSQELNLDIKHLPKVYGSGTRNYVEHYDSETRERVAESFRDEIEFFDFRFGSRIDSSTIRDVDCG